MTQIPNVSAGVDHAEGDNFGRTDPVTQIPDVSVGGLTAVRSGS